MKKTFIEQALDVLREYIDRRHGGVVSRAAKALGFKDPSLLNQWLGGTRVPSLSTLGPVLDQLGVSLHTPAANLDDFAMIPKVEAKAGAGSSLLTSDRVEGLYAFRKQFLARIGVNPDMR